MKESLPNTDGYELLSAEELIEISNKAEHIPYTLTRAIHEPGFMPAVLLDFVDGRKAYYTMATALEAINFISPK